MKLEVVNGLSSLAARKRHGGVTALTSITLDIGVGQLPSPRVEIGPLPLSAHLHFPITSPLVQETPT